MSTYQMPGLSAGTVPVQIQRTDGSWDAIATMVLSTLVLLSVVTFVPWAVPLFVPRP